MKWKIIEAIISVCFVWLCGSFLCMTVANYFIEALGSPPLDFLDGLTIFAATQYMRFLPTNTKKDE